MRNFLRKRPGPANEYLQFLTLHDVIIVVGRPEPGEYTDGRLRRSRAERSGSRDSAPVHIIERDLISERTRAAKKAQGVRIGAPERMSRDAKTKIIELRADGLSFAKIAAALEADGMLSPSGSMQWQPSTVRRAFARMEA